MELSVVLFECAIFMSFSSTQYVENTSNGLFVELLVKSIEKSTSVAPVNGLT